MEQEVALSPAKQRGALPGRSAVTTSMLTGGDAVRSLSSIWDTISFVLRTPAQQYIWNSACAEVFTRGAVSIFIAQEGTQPIAIAPLVCSPTDPGVFEMLGATELREPSDFICSDDAALSALAKGLAEKRVLLTLWRLPADSPVLQALRHAYRWRGLVRTIQGANYPFIPLTPSAPENRFSARLRADLRRARRRAEQMGEVQFELHAPATEKEFLRLFEEAMAVEASSWKGSAGVALQFNRKHQRDFFKCYGIRACEQGILRIAVLRIGGKAAAMQYAVETGGRCWLLKVGYDERFRTCSPGLLLLEATLHDAWQRSLDSYEFLGVVEEWTRRWPTEERASLSIIVYPFSKCGMRFMLRNGVRAVRRIWNRRRKGRGTR